MKQYRINELMLYREYEQEEDQILQDLGEIINSLEEEEDLAYLDEKERRELYFSCLHRLVEMAGTYGFSGNLWHCYLTYLLVNNENVFSKACEIHGLWKEASTPLPSTILTFTESFSRLILLHWKSG